MIEYSESGAAAVRCGESEIAGRRISARALPYEGEFGGPAFRFDPIDRRLVRRPAAGRIAVGPGSPEEWARAFARCPAGPVLIGPGSPAEPIYGAAAAATTGAAIAGRGVFLLDPGPGPIAVAPGEPGAHGGGLDREGSPPPGIVALFAWSPADPSVPEAGLRAARDRGIRTGILYPVLPGWTDEPGTAEAWLDRAAAAGAVSATAVPAAGDGESRRAVVDAASSLAPRSGDAMFDRVHHADWTASTDEGLRRFRAAAARRGLAPLPPRPRGPAEPAANSAAAARLEERAHELESDEHRAALLLAAARWIDESGRDLAAVVREGNFARVFPFGALAAEAESAFREERR